MNRREYIRRMIFDHFKDVDFTVDNVINYIHDQCFCDNCECNNPNTPWSD